MNYVALYRKYRPDNFDGVIGQDHIVNTLKNQIAAGKVSHAYLFCGTRGTGKTSTAKIPQTITIANKIPPATLKIFSSTLATLTILLLFIVSPPKLSQSSFRYTNTCPNAE